MTDKPLARQCSAAILTATSRAFDSLEPGDPPPALLIEGEHASLSLLSSKQILEQLAVKRGICLLENTAQSPLRSNEADVLELFGASIFEPSYAPTRQMIKERMKAAEGSSGFFIALHDADQSSLESQALLRELLAEGSFDGEFIKAPVFVVTTSQESFELPPIHNALVLRQNPPGYMAAALANSLTSSPTTHYGIDSNGPHEWEPKPPSISFAGRALRQAAHEARITEVVSLNDEEEYSTPSSTSRTRKPF